MKVEANRELRASVVLATYDRQEPLARVLEALARQALPTEEWEVVVVDDGSVEPAAPVVARYADRLQISVLRQENAGVAVARQNGVTLARGKLVIFIDDDILVASDFVAQHLAAHDGDDEPATRVVMGELLPDERIRAMPLFERFYARLLARTARELSSTRTFSGHDVYTGNLSLARELFLRVGGFDPSFWIEDVELGVRLGQAGASFVFSRAAAAVHASDHTSLEKWLARNVRDGRDWVRLLRKHPEAIEASPWRHLTNLHPAARPFLVAALTYPRGARSLSRVVFEGARGADALGFERAALAATTVVYGIQYFVGVREETGSLGDVAREYLSYRRATAQRGGRGE